MSESAQDCEAPAAKKIKLDESSVPVETSRKEFEYPHNKFENFVTPEELEKLKEFQVLDEVKSNDEDSNDDDSYSSDGKSEGLPEDEIEKMLEEDLPEGFKGAPKPKEKAYITRQKIVLEEKGVNHFEVLPLDWMMVRHYSGMPVYVHRASRVCTLSKPYFLGKGNTRRHDIPISAIPCLAYSRALEEEQKQMEIDQKIEEQIRNSKWKGPGTAELGTDNANISLSTDANYKKSTKCDKNEEVINKCPFRFSSIVSNKDVTSSSNDTYVTGLPEHLKSNIKDDGNDCFISKSISIENVPIEYENIDKKSDADSKKENMLKYIVNNITSNDKVTDNSVTSQMVTDQDGIKEQIKVHIEIDTKAMTEDTKPCEPSNENIEIDEMIVDGSSEGNDVKGASDCHIDNTFVIEKASNVDRVEGKYEILKETVVDPYEGSPKISNETSTYHNEGGSEIEGNIIEDPTVESSEITIERTDDRIEGTSKICKEASDHPIIEKSEIIKETITDLIEENSETLKEVSDDLVEETSENAKESSETGVEQSCDNSGIPIATKPDRGEVEVPRNRQPVVLPGGVMMPPPRVETVSTSWKTQHLTHEQVNEYCKRLFKFKTVNIMHFMRWADRRKYTKARKTLQYPTLPEGTTLITIPAQPANGQDNGGKSAKRDWVMNMNGRSYLSVFHEYVRRALQKQPVYEFTQLENASTPYQATVYIGGMQYGVGHGSSKRQAKSAAARASIHILIPEMKDELDAAPSAGEPDFSFFDYVGIEDPRITEFCAATCEPSPHAILRTCLLRNFGATDRHIQTEMKKLEFQKIELTMKVGKHSATVVCKNKKTAKQRASQAILQALHPHVRSWGSLLRLYGSRSAPSGRARKLEEQQITLLQEQARRHEPNHAVLRKLRADMRRLRARDAAVVPIGTLLLQDDLPTHSGANLNNVDL